MKNAQHTSETAAERDLLKEVLIGILPEYEAYVESESDVEIKMRGKAWVKTARKFIAKVDASHA